MRRAVGVFATMALIIVLVSMWMKPVPIAVEALTAARPTPSPDVISPFELMSRTSKSLPNQYYRDPF